MTNKPDPGAAPITPVVDVGGNASSGLFDFGAPAATRKRLFQFAKPSVAKRSRKTALGPSRSEYGCD